MTLIQDRFSAKAEQRKAVTARSVKVKCGRDLDVDATIEGPTSYTELVGEIVTELSWSIMILLGLWPLNLSSPGYTHRGQVLQPFILKRES